VDLTGKTSICRQIKLSGMLIFIYKFYSLNYYCPNIIHEKRKCMPFKCLIFHKSCDIVYTTK
jgi:hypothetical protein